MQLFTKAREIKVESSESKQRMLDFMYHHSVGVLATVDPNGDPDATTIYYTVRDDFEVTFMTKRGTKKYDNLLHKNHTVLVIYEPVSQTVLQVRGIAEEIKDITRTNEVFDGMLRGSLKTSEAGIPPLSKLHLGDYVAYRIRPRQVRMAVFIRPDAGGYEMYETIDLND